MVKGVLQAVGVAHSLCIYVSHDGYNCLDCHI